MFIFLTINDVIYYNTKMSRSIRPGRIRRVDTGGKKWKSVFRFTTKKQTTIVASFKISKPAGGIEPPTY
ncbi:MAG: hypothetical protein A2042_09580 [Candidatus Schekmanbacteria bacterium GWA2_38_11]|uniref:Uncharacterized protein n=1 Tax=Candidatus Schekmanbacteria bacterium GWA2_38_11 TaxID=1817876 RepID=A0A1F7RMW9_9BACT|nr:MAG: hypothetical protein A2042_09580 [Candidatus Schekmanbacteria bacterium GWA2_38_11]